MLHVLDMLGALDVVGVLDMLGVLDVLVLGALCWIIVSTSLYVKQRCF